MLLGMICYILWELSYIKCLNPKYHFKRKCKCLIVEFPNQIKKPKILKFQETFNLKLEGMHL